MAVYLDHAATTPMLPEARQAFIDALDLVGNPSSIHSQGQNAKRMLEEAREQVATSLGCDPIEIVFIRRHRVDQPRAEGAVLGTELRCPCWSRPRC
jgi:cysteine sulfinate desulfinase/cysteine desulfurase-like protein